MICLQASRAQILNKATDYIQFMRRKNHSHQVSAITVFEQKSYCSSLYLHQKPEVRLKIFSNILGK